jgi:hypothetical protein
VSRSFATSQKIPGTWRVGDGREVAAPTCSSAVYDPLTTLIATEEGNNSGSGGKKQGRVHNMVIL